MISKENNKNNFENYITGLIEGDGHIFVPKTDYSEKGKKNYPSIQICFHAKDFPLAMKIQEILGNGSLAKKQGVNAYVLTVNNEEGVCQMIEILHGRMRTPKINSYYKLLDMYTERGKLTKGFERKSINTEPIESNS